MATHPVVGTWEFTGEVAGSTFPILATFYADGNYQEVYPWGAIMIGVWKPTGERTAEGTMVIYEYLDDRLLRGRGGGESRSMRPGIRIAIDGPFVARYVDDDSVDMAVEGTSTGTQWRSSVVPLSELVPGGTPVLPAEWTGAAHRRRSHRRTDMTSEGRESSRPSLVSARNRFRRRGQHPRDRRQDRRRVRPGGDRASPSPARYPRSGRTHGARCRRRHQRDQCATYARHRGG